MFRFAAASVVLIATTAQAALTDSDWGPNQASGSRGQLVFNDGRADYIVGSIEFGGDRAWRASIEALTLDADWRVQARVHIDSLFPAARQAASIGLGISKPGASSPIDLGYIRLWSDGSTGRSVSSYIRRDDIGGPGESQFLTNADLLLALDYSASERIIRSYYKRGSGELTELQSGSVNGWGIGSGDSLSLNIVGESYLMELIPGQVYLSDLAPVPEPSLLAWLAMVPFAWTKTKPQPAQ